MIPAAMLLVLVAVQACLWAHAATLVQAAATQGAETACLEGQSLAAGVDEARQVIAASGSGVVSNLSVQAAGLPGDTVELRVTATAESIVPWLRIPVSAVQVGVKQEFRVSG